MIIFTVPGPPMGKQRARTLKNGHSYTPKETKEYEALVVLCYRSAVKHTEILTTMTQVAIRAYYPIPKSFSKQKRAQALSGHLRPTVKPDIDNIEKIIFDALEGLAYKNDSQIVTSIVDKWYWYEPRVDVLLADGEWMAVEDVKLKTNKTPE